ncbi:chaperonin GroEL, partial [Reticulomyxa filosa]
NIEFEDKYENLGAQLVRHVASKTNDVAGDGTTTATVLVRAIFREGCRAVAAGLNPMDVKRGIDKAVSKVLEHLKSIAELVQDKDSIFKVATISANGDRKLGQLIADAFEKMGNQGIFRVVDVVEGMRFDRVYLSPWFITDARKQIVEYDNPVLLFADKKMSSGAALAGLMEQVYMHIFVCYSLTCTFLRDMSILTGGQVVSEDLGQKIEDVQLGDLGRCGRIAITKDDTTILNGSGKREDIDERNSQ